MKIRLQADVQLNTEAIKSDIKRFCDIYCETIAREASNLISNFAAKEMAGYYGEYTPMEYVRTNQMRNNSYKSYYNTNGTVYEGGIVIDSNYTYHTPKQISEAQIYENVWDRGIHGYTHIKYNSAGGNVDTWNIIQGMPDRIGRLKQQAYSDKTKQLLINKGIANARRAGGYSILKF